MGARKKSSAEAYREEVEKVPAAARARAAAAAAAEGGAPLGFVNRRHPFAMLDRLGKAQIQQLKQLARQNGAGRIEKLVDDSDWNPMELVDVVDTQTGAVTHQFYSWPYGSGQLFEHDSTRMAGVIVQHAYDLYGSNNTDREFRRALAAAYSVAPLAETIDFRLDEDAPVRVVAEEVSPKDMKRLIASLGNDHTESRSIHELTATQRALVREVFSAVEQHHTDEPRMYVEKLGKYVLDPSRADRTSLRALGLPSWEILRRELGLDPPTVFEKQIAGRCVWRRVREREDLDALGDEEVIELGLRAAREWSELFELHGDAADTERDAFASSAVLFLAAAIDKKDGATTFAQRARVELKDARFFLGAIAAAALAAHARRNRTAFPETWFDFAREHLELSQMGRS